MFRVRAPRATVGLAAGTCLVAALAARPAGAVEAAPVATSSAIRLSGVMRPEVWDTATPISDFLQREPQEGAPPTERTEFRVVYDASTIYVRVRAFESEPGRIVGYLTRRDDDSPSDWIHVFIDSYHDRRTAYEFAVNPAGVKADRYWSNDTNEDKSWDAVWDVAVSRDAQGWTAEFRIPLSQLRYTPRDSATFGFAVAREIKRKNETVTWPLLARSATGFVSSLGNLIGLAMTAPPKRLELVPYSVADLTRQRTAGNPLLKPSAPGSSFGLDAKYALTPGLTLTTTFNPDFGQVEADPAVVNLTAFETFFNERRPFFVEGSGTFQFSLDCFDGPCTGLFYSRRIGRAPQGTGNLPSGDNVYTDSPLQTTILGAAKVTGRVGRFSIGAMQAVTQRESADVLDGPRRFSQGVEPLTSYSVGRVRREFANQSSIGAMFTATKRPDGGDFRFLPTDATAGGVDFDWRFKKRYSVTGYLVGSRVAGDPEAITDLQENSRHYYQRPDLVSERLDPTRTFLSGTAGRIQLSKIGGQKVHFTSTASFKSPGFDIDDLGFFRRADERTTYNWLQIRSDVPSKHFRMRMINFNHWYSWNADGQRLQQWVNVNAHATWQSNWSMGTGVTINQRAIDDRLTRGGPGGLSDGFIVHWAYVNSDERKPIWFNSFQIYGGDGHGSHLASADPSVRVRPMSAMTVEAGVHLEHNVNDYQWVNKVTAAGADHFVFAHLNQTTVSLTGRLNYTMRPTLSLQLYAQPFVSGGAYGPFKELVDGHNPVYGQRYAPYAYTDNPDFNYKSFRTTNVLRWEYKPGSTLFVVWQQARGDTSSNGDFRFGRDFRGIFHVVPRNVLLVKLSYWLNY
jgi:hypothetical protein